MKIKWKFVFASEILGIFTKIEENIESRHTNALIECSNLQNWEFPAGRFTARGRIAMAGEIPEDNQSDVWKIGFLEQILMFFRSKKWTYFCFEAV